MAEQQQASPGLLSEEQPPSRPVDQPTMVGPEGAPEATPESQEAYERTVIALNKAIYNKATSDSLIKMMQQQADDPPVAIGETAAMLVTRLDEESGGKIPEDVIIPASMEAVAELGEVAEAAGLFEATPEVLKEAAIYNMGRLFDEYGVEEDDLMDLMEQYSDNPQVVAAVEGLLARSGGDDSGMAPAQPPGPPAAAAPPPDQGVLMDG